MVWDGRELAQIDDWSFELGSAEIDQLRAAITSSLSSTKPLAEQSCRDYDLARLSERLQRSYWTNRRI